MPESENTYALNSKMIRDGSWEEVTFPFNLVQRVKLLSTKIEMVLTNSKPKVPSTHKSPQVTFGFRLLVVSLSGMCFHGKYTFGI